MVTENTFSICDGAFIYASHYNGSWVANKIWNQLDRLQYRPAMGLDFDSLDERAIETYESLIKKYEGKN